MVPFSKNICLSGGADGADLQWGMCAGKQKHTVIHWTFNKHKSKAPKEELVYLNDNQLNEAEPFCIKANDILHRTFPTSSEYVNNLIKRNYYQIRDSASCYAVSIIKNNIVQGDTAWAVQMFLDKFDNKECNCYVFCQEISHWFKWNGIFWESIYEPPIPQNIWTGIGTRKLNSIGKLAIRTILNYKNIRNSNVN